MNCIFPATVQSLFQAEYGIFQPTLIEEISGAIWASGPCQRGDCIDYKANALQSLGLVSGRYLPFICFSVHEISPTGSLAFHKLCAGFNSRSRSWRNQ